MIDNPIEICADEKLLKNFNWFVTIEEEIQPFSKRNAN